MELLDRALAVVGAVVLVLVGLDLAWAGFMGVVDAFRLKFRGR